MLRSNEGRARRPGSLNVPPTLLTPGVTGERTLRRLADWLERAEAQLEQADRFHGQWGLPGLPFNLPTPSVGDSAETTIHTPMVGHIGSTGVLGGTRPDFNTLWDYAGPRESVAASWWGRGGGRSGRSRRGGGGGDGDDASDDIRERAKAIEDLAEALGELRKEFVELVSGDPVEEIEDLTELLAEGVEAVGEAARDSLDGVLGGYSEFADELGTASESVYELNGALGAMVSGVEAGTSRIKGILEGTPEWMAGAASNAGSSWAAVFDGLAEQLDREVLPRLERAVALVGVVNNSKYRGATWEQEHVRRREFERVQQGEVWGDGSGSTNVYIDGRRLARSVQETSGERSVEVSSF